jgi:glutamyl-tRNA synthetase
MQVVTRFPPSPTGDLHIGGARTALFNWAFARHSGGTCLLRFEDTDRERSSTASETAILEALEWLGLDYDPVPGSAGIPRQTERLERYGEALGALLDSGAAYRCVCTPEEVEAMRERARAGGGKPGYDGRCREGGIGPAEERPFCVRLRVAADGPTRWQDLIAGASGEDASELDDFVLERTDGTPIYHLAVVVDDHDMGVTHVIRGREHMSSTPRQLLIYAALGWTPPEFAHVPLLVEPGGKKLSKRHASVSVTSYRERGYTPEAVVNYLGRLGWGHGDLEVFSAQDFARLFTLDGVGRSPSQVHDDKLDWLNKHYLKSLPLETLLRYLTPFLEREAGRALVVDGELERLIDLLRQRSTTLAQLAELARFYLRDDVETEPKAASKHLRADIGAPLHALVGELGALAHWDEAGLGAAFERVIADHGLELGKLAQPVRVAITGSTVSPGIYETLSILGRERSLARLTRALETLAKDADTPAADPVPPRAD